VGLEWVSGWGHQQWEIEIGYWRASASGLLPRVAHDWDSKGSGAARTSRRCRGLRSSLRHLTRLVHYISVVPLSDVDACQCETPDPQDCQKCHVVGLRVGGTSVMGKCT
jgi:hypothetical protein